MFVYAFLYLVFLKGQVEESSLMLVFNVSTLPSYSSSCCKYMNNKDRRLPKHFGTRQHNRSIRTFSKYANIHIVTSSPRRRNNVMRIWRINVILSNSTIGYDSVMVLELSISYTYNFIFRKLSCPMQRRKQHQMNTSHNVELEYSIRCPDEFLLMW